MLTLGLRLALALFLLVPCLLLARRIGRTLIARYDDGALRVEPAGAVRATLPRDLDVNQKAAWMQLQQWCFDGAAMAGRHSGGRGLCRALKGDFLSPCCWAGEGRAGPQLAEAFSREIDGSHQLQQAGGAWSRLRLRLRVKWHDCVWWRTRKPTDPWDSGYLADDPLALEHLRKFLPRRATLMVADAMTSAALLERIAVLSERYAAFHHPVRLLIVGNVLPTALRLTRDAEGTSWQSALPGVGAVPVIILAGE